MLTFILLLLAAFCFAGAVYVHRRTPASFLVPLGLLCWVLARLIEAGRALD